MTPDPTLVDLIVAAVERRLADGPSGPADRPDAPSQDGEEIVCCETVVTAEIVSGRLTERSRRLRISSDSILTPSARELVARHDLAVACDVVGSSDVATTASSSPGTWQILLADPDVPQLRGFVSERTSGSDTAVATACDWVSEAIGRGAVVLSTDPHRVACLANRHPRVRAVVVKDAEEATRLLVRLGANVLVACPLAVGAWQSRQIVEACLVVDSPQPPSDWPSDDS